MKDGTVSVVEMMTNGQALEIASALVQAAPRLIDRGRADELIRDKGVWQDRVRGIFSGAVTVELDVSRELESWERRYSEDYNRRLNLSQVIIPPPPVGKFRQPKFLVVDPTVKLNQIFSACAKIFPSWRYVDDLDGTCAKEPPRPEEVYAVWTEGAVEASEEYANLSPDQLDERRIAYQVIRERMLLEHSHYLATTGGHLDLVNMTITSSRSSDGSTFYADWSDRQFKVSWWYRDLASPRGRVREVVLPS